MQKSFKQRLAELERLEAEAEQQRQAAEESGIPDLDAMDDLQVLWEAVLGMRRGNPHAGPRLDWTVEPHRIELLAYGCADRRWTPFIVALARRAQPLIEACPYPFIALAPWEVEDAIALIDSGRCDVVPLWPAAVAELRGSHYALRLDAGARTDEDGNDTIEAVNYAVRLWVADWSSEERRLGNDGAARVARVAGRFAGRRFSIAQRRAGQGAARF